MTEQTRRRQAPLSEPEGCPAPPGLRSAATREGGASQGIPEASGKVLIAGVGNIFLGDDGFGVAVAGRLAAADLPGGVKVVDYGIRGMHLAYDLSGYDTAILIDATPRGGAPGTIYVIEPELSAPAEPGPDASARAASDAAADVPGTGTGTGSGDGGPDDPAAALPASPLLDAHGMQPDVVFSMLDTLGGNRPDRILVVGCEPASTEYAMSLSAPVAAAVDEAVRVVLELVGAGQRAGEGDVMAADAPGADGQHLLTKGWAHVPGHSG